MGIKQQFAKIKENWLILVIALVVLFLMMGGQNLFGSFSTMVSESRYGSERGYVGDYEAAPASSRSIPGISEMKYDAGSTGTQAKDRKVVKTSSLSTEVETGTFDSAQLKLKETAKSSDSIILSEYVNKYGTEGKSYWYTGEYQLKVDVKKYDSVVNQLKAIGKVKYFRENQQDITEEYQDAEIELKTEKDRLKRYQEMYEEAVIIEDKIELSNLIFDQERRIEYMEEALKTADERVDYATVYVTLTEKKPDYADIVFVKLTDLVERFVGSINSVVSLLVSLVPWAAAVWLIRVIWKKVKGKAKG